jgi:CheY-like chemotaxis protein
VPASAPFTDDEARVMQAGVELPMRAAGCPACGFTGFRGRIVAAQVLDVTSAVRQMIIENAKLDALRATAHDAGMRTLAASALERVRAGDTTAAEAVAELGNDFWRGLGIEAPVRSRRERGNAAPKVLLVERDAAARMTLRAELERAGFVVEEAEHAGAARERIELAGDFAAIVLDLDGLLAERVQRLLSLRDSLAGAAIPVVALSDQRAPALEAAVRAHGGATLLQKPVDAARVVQTLRGALQ